MEIIFKNGRMSNVVQIDIEDGQLKPYLKAGLHLESNSRFNLDWAVIVGATYIVSEGSKGEVDDESPNIIVIHKGEITFETEFEEVTRQVTRAQIWDNKEWSKTR